MKTSLIISVFYFSLPAFSQNFSEKELKKHTEQVTKSKEKGIVILSLDTIFSKGVPYAIMKVEKSGFIKNYSVRSLKGEELIYVKSETYETPNTNRVNQYDAATITHKYYRFTFIKSKNVAEMESKGLKDKDMEEVIVMNELIDGGAFVSSDAETKFIARYPPTISGNVNQPVVVNNIIVNNYNLVERNRSMQIFVSGADIKQDFKVIGTSQKSQQAANGTIIYTINVFLPDGVKIAVATSEGVSSKSWKVVTMKDNKVNYVESKFSDEIRSIAKYLVDSYYL